MDCAFDLQVLFVGFFIPMPRNSEIDLPPARQGDSHETVNLFLIICFIV